MEDVFEDLWAPLEEPDDMQWSPPITGNKDVDVNSPMGNQSQLNEDDVDDHQGPP